MRQLRSFAFTIQSGLWAELGPNVSKILCLSRPSFSIDLALRLISLQRMDTYPRITIPIDFHDESRRSKVAVKIATQLHQSAHSR
jgi:hypothetical protein